MVEAWGGAVAGAAMAAAVEAAMAEAEDSAERQSVCQVGSSEAAVEMEMEAGMA